MVYTTQNVRDNIRNAEGRRVFYLSPSDRITDEARDYLKEQDIQVLPAHMAKPEYYETLSGVKLSEKPEHMTHLRGRVLVEKTHPRIAFRGAVDSLEAELLLCILKLPELAAPLGEILDLARMMIRCDVMEEPLENKTLCGLTEAEQRQHSHFPKAHYGIPHFMPQSTDGEKILHLNKVRCVARQTELAAVRAFVSPEGVVTRPDILRAMNRMSSMLYILMIRLKADQNR